MTHLTLGAHRIHVAYEKAAPLWSEREIERRTKNEDAKGCEPWNKPQAVRDKLQSDYCDGQQYCGPDHTPQIAPRYWRPDTHREPKPDK